MKFSVTFVLFVLVCVVGGSIWFLENREVETVSKNSLFGVSATDINGITLERGKTRIVIVNRDDGWFLDSPVKSRADGGQVNRLLGIIESAKMSSDAEITPEQRKIRNLSLKDFGLIETRGRVIVNTRLGPVDVVIGSDEPLGDMVYAMKAGTENVVSVHKSLYEALPSKVEDIRDKVLIQGNASLVSKIEIQKPGSGFIQLIQDDGEWSIRQPLETRADPGKVQAFISHLFALRVSRYVWDPLIKPVENSTAVEVKVGDGTQQDMGFEGDGNAATVTVWVNGDEEGQQLILGKELEGGKEIYAKLRDYDSVYSVNKSIVDKLSFKLDALRDKGLFTKKYDEIKYLRIEKQDKRLTLVKDKLHGWTIKEPVQWPADNSEVRSTIEKILSMRAGSFVDTKKIKPADMGLEPWSYSIHVARNVPAPDKPLNGEGKTVMLVGKMKDDSSDIYAMFNKASEAFTIAAKDVYGSDRKDPVDPLIFRNRTMLAVPPDKVKKLSIVKGGREQVVSRSDNGSWEVYIPASTNRVATNVVRTVVPAAVQNVLFNVANMRAVKIRAHNPENLAVYGLEKPAEILTLGLSKEEGIQKSVMLGSSDGISGRYAMVQGQDVVFVLPGDVVGQLTSDLIKTSLKEQKPDEKEE